MSENTYTAPIVSRADFMEALYRGAKMNCPCCGRYAQIYKRKFNSGMACQLIKLLNLKGDKIFVHASDLILRGVAGAADLTKSKYWGLIEPMPHEEGEKKSSGFWRLTEKGFFFVTGKTSIPEYAFIYDDDVLDYSSKEIFIKQALENKFDYLKLMSWRPAQ